MKDRFRIVELPFHQVLLTKDWDNENDEAPFVCSISFFIAGVKIIQSLGYSSEEDRDNIFETATPEQLESTVLAIADQFS